MSNQTECVCVTVHTQCVCVTVHRQSVCVSLCTHSLNMTEFNFNLLSLLMNFDWTELDVWTSYIIWERNKKKKTSWEGIWTSEMPEHVLKKCQILWVTLCNSTRLWGRRTRAVTSECFCSQLLVSHRHNRRRLSSGCKTSLTSRFLTRLWMSVSVIKTDRCFVCFHWHVLY